MIFDMSAPNFQDPRNDEQSKTCADCCYDPEMIFDMSAPNFQDPRNNEQSKTCADCCYDPEMIFGMSAPNFHDPRHSEQSRTRVGSKSNTPHSSLLIALTKNNTN